MSKTHEKTQAAAPAEAATGPAAAALVSAEPATKAQDMHHGRGGLYTVVNGVRQRVGGTEQASMTKDTEA